MVRFLLLWSPLWIAVIALLSLGGNSESIAWGRLFSSGLETLMLMGASVGVTLLFGVSLGFCLSQLLPEKTKSEVLLKVPLFFPGFLAVLFWKAVAPESMRTDVLIVLSFAAWGIPWISYETLQSVRVIPKTLLETLSLLGLSRMRRLAFFWGPYFWNAHRSVRVQLVLWALTQYTAVMVLARGEVETLEVLIKRSLTSADFQPKLAAFALLIQMGMSIVWVWRRRNIVHTSFTSETEIRTKSQVSRPWGMFLLWGLIGISFIPFIYSVIQGATQHIYWSLEDGARVFVIVSVSHVLIYGKQTYRWKWEGLDALGGVSSIAMAVGVWVIALFLHLESYSQAVLASVTQAWILLPFVDRYWSGYTRSEDFRQLQEEVELLGVRPVQALWVAGGRSFVERLAFSMGLSITWVWTEFSVLDFFTDSSFRPLTYWVHQAALSYNFQAAFGMLWVPVAIGVGVASGVLGGYELWRWARA